MDELLREMHRLAEAGEVFAVATIVGAEGSSPRHLGAKMVVRADGSIAGSVGGGAVERYVHEQAMRLMRHRASDTVEADLSSLGMACGGRVTVFIETHAPVHRLLVCGGGHIGAAIADLAAKLGFSFSVADDRPEYCSRERFPLAESLYYGPYAEVVPSIPLDASTAAVIVTHAHANDLVCLRALARSGAGYVGMIGSRAKVAEHLQRLREEGVPEDALARVRAPVGLDIGAESAYEIAVAILAEVMAVLRGASGLPMREAVLGVGRGRKGRPPAPPCCAAPGGGAGGARQRAPARTARGRGRPPPS